MRRCIKIRSCERLSWTEAHFRDTSHRERCTATDRTFHQPLSPCTSASPASSLCVSPHSLLLYTPSKVFTLIPSIKLSSFLAVLPSRTRPVPIPSPPGFCLFRLVSPFLRSAFHIPSHTPSGRHQKRRSHPHSPPAPRTHPATHARPLSRWRVSEKHFGAASSNHTQSLDSDRTGLTTIHLRLLCHH